MKTQVSITLNFPECPESEFALARNNRCISVMFNMELPPGIQKGTLIRSLLQPDEELGYPCTENTSFEVQFGSEGYRVYKGEVFQTIVLKGFERCVTKFDFDHFAKRIQNLCLDEPQCRSSIFKKGKSVDLRWKISDPFPMEMFSNRSNKKT